MLDSQTLINTASEQSGLSDFGDPSFREGLDKLVGALNTEAKLTEAASGRVGCRSRIILRPIPNYSMRRLKSRPLSSVCRARARPWPSIY
jgi:hypothetical protein